jgi:hypothetical protein
MAVADLCHAAMPAPVVGDDPVTLAEKEKHLRVPVISRQQPAVAEDDGLADAPVLVKNLHTVCFLDGAHTHSPLLSGTLADRDVLVSKPKFR